jgi:hypothetical protein
MVTHADVIAKRLADAGIEYIFGMPGSRASVELIEAAQKLGIHYVLSNNEAPPPSWQPPTVSCSDGQGCVPQASVQVRPMQ